MQVQPNVKIRGISREREIIDYGHFRKGGGGYLLYLLIR